MRIRPQHIGEAELFLPGCMKLARQPVARVLWWHAPLRRSWGARGRITTGGGQRRSLARTLLRRTVPSLTPRVPTVIMMKDTQPTSRYSQSFSNISRRFGIHSVLDWGGGAYGSSANSESGGR